MQFSCRLRNQCDMYRVVYCIKYTESVYRICSKIQENITFVTVYTRWLLGDYPLPGLRPCTPLGAQTPYTNGPPNF